GGARSTASSPDAVPARTSPADPQTPSGTVRPRRGARTPPPDRPRSEWPSLCPSPPFPAIPRSTDRKRDVEDRHHRLLYDFVFQRRDADRPLPTVRFPQINPP